MPERWGCPHSLSTHTPHTHTDVHHTDTHTFAERPSGRPGAPHFVGKSFLPGWQWETLCWASHLHLSLYETQSQASVDVTIFRWSFHSDVMKLPP